MSQPFTDQNYEFISTSFRAMECGAIYISLVPVEDHSLVAESSSK